MARRRPGRSDQQRPKAYRIFLSHASTDKWIAKIICEKLDEIGLTSFRDDRDIRGGDDIPDEIQNEIRRCDELLVLLTPQSIGRVWVMLEIGMALARKRRIVPLLYHISVDPIPDMLKSKKAYALNDIDVYFDEVRERLAKKVV